MRLGKAGVLKMGRDDPKLGCVAAISSFQTIPRFELSGGRTQSPHRVTPPLKMQTAKAKTSFFHVVRSSFIRDSIHRTTFCWRRPRWGGGGAVVARYIRSPFAQSDAPFSMSIVQSGRPIKNSLTFRGTDLCIDNMNRLKRKIL